ncbi:uncharacterized protein [Littorina saxatilis]|uniref:Cadherin domain-containing protein n=1 Tax=Littorina saxatilis TaxID=31220 RepID=A0AAN9FY00_9CAEN
MTSLARPCHERTSFLRVMLFCIINLRFTVSDDGCGLVSPVRSVTVPERTPAGTELIELKWNDASITLEWSFVVVVKNHSQKLKEYFESALTFVPARNGNPCKCRSNSSCILKLTNAIDAEAIGPLANPDDKPEEVLSSAVHFVCIDVNAHSSRSSITGLLITSTNEYSPNFDPLLRDIKVPETTRRDTTIILLDKFVTDNDYGFGGHIKNFSLETSTDFIGLKNRTIVLMKEFDFDEQLKQRKTSLLFRLKATDSEGRAGAGYMILNLTDSDTHPPYYSSFGCKRLIPCGDVIYTASVYNKGTGEVKDIQPDQIKAEDGDTLSAPITYSITGSYNLWLEIDADTGRVTILEPLEELQESSIEITVVATEYTTLRRNADATLIINVETTRPTTIVTTTVNNDVNSTSTDVTSTSTLTKKKVLAATSLSLILAGVIPGLIIFCLGGALITWFVCRQRKAKKERWTAIRLHIRPPADLPSEDTLERNRLAIGLRGSKTDVSDSTKADVTDAESTVYSDDGSQMSEVSEASDIRLDRAH